MASSSPFLDCYFIVSTVWLIILYVPASLPRETDSGFEATFFVLIEHRHILAVNTDSLDPTAGPVRQ